MSKFLTCYPDTMPAEWLVLKKVESSAGNDLAADAVVVVEYVDGVVTQG